MISLQQYTILKLITNNIKDPLLNLELEMQSKGLNSLERRASDARVKGIVLGVHAARSFVPYLWSHSPTSYSTLFTYVADNYIEPNETSYKDYLSVTKTLFGVEMLPNLERINDVFGEIYSINKR